MPALLVESLMRVRHPAMVPITDIATRETPLRVALRSWFVVVGFWWSATGAIFALERSAATRTLGLVLASALALWGGALVVLERDRDTPSGARRAFLGAAFLWSWVQVAFYGAWIVGPEARMVPVPAEAPGWGLAVRAVASMLWYQLTMLAVMGWAWRVTTARVNRMAWWTLTLFWLVHQVASVNIFLGVENPGRGFFPEPLAYLESYFGPVRNSWLLPASIAVLLTWTIGAVVQALRGPTPYRRQAMMLLSVIGVLSVAELAILGAPLTVPLWEAFLAIRGY